MFEGVVEGGGKMLEKNVVDDVPFHVVIGCGGARQTLAGQKRCGIRRSIEISKQYEYRYCDDVLQEESQQGPKEFNWSAHFSKLFSSLKNKGLQ